MTDTHRCPTCGLPDGPDYGDPHQCPPGFEPRGTNVRDVMRAAMMRTWSDRADAHLVASAEDHIDALLDAAFGSLAVPVPPTVTDALDALLEDLASHAVLESQPAKHRTATGAWVDTADVVRSIRDLIPDTPDPEGPAHLLTGILDGENLLVTVWPDGTGEVAVRGVSGTWGPPSRLEPAP